MSLLSSSLGRNAVRASALLPAGAASAVAKASFVRRAAALPLRARALTDAARQSSSSAVAAHKEVKFSNDGRAAMLRGVNLLANAVSVTLGPKGACGWRASAHRPGMR